MFYQLLRKDALCPGPNMCPHALDDESPCGSCGLELLEDALRSTRAGELIRSALDLDFTKNAGIQIGPDEVSAEDFRVLKIIASERARHENEEREAHRREAESAARRR